MYITFYDRFFNSIADNSSLKIESYTLKKRSYDLNELELVCEPIDLDIEPMFATIRNERGAVFYDCLAPILTRGTDNKSKVIARDLKGLFNTEIVYDGTVPHKTISDFLTSVFNAWKNFVAIGFEKIIFDTTKIKDLQGEVYQPEEKKSYNAWDVLKQAMAVYNLHLNTRIDYRTRSMIFEVEKNDEFIQNVKLEDYGIVDFNKTPPAVNTAVVVDGNYDTLKTWRLLKNGSISDLRSAELYPASTKVFKSNTDAILCLAENRNQEAIELKITEKDRLFAIDFNSSLMIYYKGKEYKQLPIGEIEYNNKDERKITIGSKPLDFVQVI